MEVEGSSDSLDGYIMALKQTPTDNKTIMHFLRFIRQTKLRRSDAVVRYGQILLKNNISILDEAEVWDVREQVFVAALDENNMTLASQLLGLIRHQFGDSGVRVKRLMGLHKEAQGKWKEAEQIYKLMLDEDPVNSMAMKRQIAIRKAIGDPNATIKLLNEYLKIFMGDVEVWQELADVYMDQQMYKNAAFCYEELLLAMPGNYHLHSKYAEILYTMGGFENFRLARKYFSHALEMSDNFHARTLYGLLMCTIAIASTRQGKQDLERNQDPDNITLFDFAYQKLFEKYKDQAPQHLEGLKILARNKGKDEE